MALPSAVSAVGLAALIALPGQPAPEDEGPVPGAGSLHVTVEERSEERLGVGDRVEYTIRVRNAGYEAVPGAEVVQFLPESMRYVSGAPEGVETGLAVWERPLEPGEREVLTVTAEVAALPERGVQPVSTVCLRPSADAELASCSASVHLVHRQVPVAWVVAGVVLSLSVALGVGGYLRHRRKRGPGPEPEPTMPEDHGPETVPEDHGPETVPEDPTVPGRAPVYHLDARR
ncbi:DUF6479 family protein [Nocardiopsis sp. MG754419]|uniref:DUF6479 family protein n=1 Tax=Nocardiopsis sp. MG754419 TaxID=2259865 RepID=UPI001BAD0EC7|nr:DUF11 domain-containing protein [Nocardiopsis sp. MG754419]MBR8741930.1 hypothetical protein [Nocardiopsis sp. MG754419]